MAGVLQDEIAVGQGDVVATLMPDDVWHNAVFCADAKWGEAVTAVVAPLDGAVLDPAEAIAFCRARVAGYETPKQVMLVDELPTTVGGKVLKYRLRAEMDAAR